MTLVIHRITESLVIPDQSPVRRPQSPNPGADRKSLVVPTSACGQTLIFSLWQGSLQPGGSGGGTPDDY